MNSKKLATLPFWGSCLVSSCSSGVLFRPHLLLFFDFEGDGDCEISLSETLFDRSFISCRRLSPRRFFCTFVINLSFGCVARGPSSRPGDDTRPAARDHQLSRRLSGDLSLASGPFSFDGLMLLKRVGLLSKVAGIARNAVLSGVASLSIIDDCSGDFGVSISDIVMSTSACDGVAKVGPDLKEENGVFGPNDLTGDKGFAGDPNVDLAPVVC